MIIGYILSGHDNGALFFDNAPEGVLCPKCSSCLDWSYVPERVKLHPSKRYDFSYTWDGRILVSPRFREFSVENRLEGSERFIHISKNPELYYFRGPKEQIEFDVERRETQFSERCTACGSYEYVVGALPGFTKLKRLNQPVFYRTDVMFGDGSRKNCLVAVNPEVKRLLTVQKFRGLAFNELLFSGEARQFFDVIEGPM